jgi:hypothetical protein
MEFRNLVESRREHHNIYYHITNTEFLQDCLIMANRPKDKLLEINPI